MKTRTNLKAWLTMSVFLIGVGLVTQGVVVGDTFTVINTNDSGAGSLREAIDLANINSGLDLIAFNIPGPGPHTIQPLTALPWIIDPVTIDGYTQPGAIPATYASPATLLVELDGSNVSSDIGGLKIWLVGNSTVRGLVINRFPEVAIHVQEGGGNVIEGNYIGTDVTGTVDLGNFDHGIRIWDSPDNTIGGTSPAARNVISGNVNMGIQLLLPFCVGNKVQGNYIGTDATGTAALGNGEHGILMSEGMTNTTIGPGNVISGNGGAGIEISGNNEAGNHQILSNLIGTDASGTAALGNWCGIRLMGQNGNTVEGNTISNNDLVGIWMGDGDPSGLFSHDNTVAGNTIRSNGGYGIQIMYSNNNTIYNNNFIDNIADQAVVEGGSGNVFNHDLPIGGNYWSDWIGPDEEEPFGIVDEPYVFYGGQDNLPWIIPYGWLSPQLLTEQLITQVEGLNLQQGIENSLHAKLDAVVRVLDDLNQNNDVAAIYSLEAFINEVEAQRGTKISDADADALIAPAKQILYLLNSV